MFSYQKIVNSFINEELDKDTKNIVMNYSVFYIKNDYEKITNILEKKMNKIKNGFFDFLCLNILNYDIFNQCNSKCRLDSYLSLNQIVLITNNLIFKETNYNKKLFSFVSDLYYESPFYLPTRLENIFLKSKKYLKKELELLKMSDDEINDYLKFLSKYFLDIINEKDYFYDNYKDNFIEYYKILNL